MWKPPQRIPKPPDPGPWPSAKRAAEAMLFSPLTQGRLSLSARTWVPAMVPWRATEEGFVTDDVVEWYERFAYGKPGAIVIEATGVRDVPSGPLLRLGHDRYIPGIKRVVDAVKRASGGETKLFIQLIDFLAVKRRPAKEKYFRHFLSITDSHRDYFTGVSDQDIREQLIVMDDDEIGKVLNEREFDDYRRGYRERVTDEHLPHIADLPQVLPDLFSAAARRAEKAGLDGVELHYAHAYTMASFLSKKNTRQDGYGGNRRARIRSPLEVFAAVRGAVSEKFVVGARMLSDDCIEGGLDIDDAVYFASEFATAEIDFISLSRGGKFEDAAIPRVGQAIYPYTGQSGYECMPHFISDETGPYGRNVPSSRKIKNAIYELGKAVPIIVAGGIHGFDQAERVLESGAADIIGMARQILADPDWFEKVRRGRGQDVRTCKYTNYCEGLDQKHKVVTCQLWDRLDLEAPNTSKTSDGKRRTTAPLWRPAQL